MKQFDVYTRYDLTLERAKGIYLYDAAGNRYLDLYGGHGVISIGHGHPAYVKAISDQLRTLGFYSNSIHLPVQDELAKKLGEISGYADYDLFLCNSGAEANENALKLASFHTGRKKVVAFYNSFHGRTSAALNVTDDPKISAPINTQNFPVGFIELNNSEQLLQTLNAGDVCAVIVEGIQGVGGLGMPDPDFLRLLEEECRNSGALLILDEIQSGYGRSGKFFAHQHAGITPDIITVAKGMGNGFPVAGVLISPDIQAHNGMLGTTFGGNPLACAAGLAVLETIASEHLIDNAAAVGQCVHSALSDIPGIRKVKGKGLMLGIELDTPVSDLRKNLLYEHRIFTGSASNPNLIRILPPLGISYQQSEPFVHAMKALLS